MALLRVPVVAFGALQLGDAVRSCVKGESLWSKGQKEAVIALQEYARSGPQYEWRQYREAIAVPLGGRQARRALQAVGDNFGYPPPDAMEGRHVRVLYPSDGARERYRDRLRETGSPYTDETPTWWRGSAATGSSPCWWTSTTRRTPGS